MANSKLSPEKSHTNNIVRLAGASALSYEALAIDGATDALNLANLGMQNVGDLRAILRAIFELTGFYDEPEHDVIRNLAKVGVELADDRHNTFDAEREVREEKLTALRGANRV